ncbi:MAG: DUF92 domain-containing protein [Acidobacteriota bacterium]
MTSPDGKRKAVHAGMGLFALTLRFLDGRGAAFLALSALLFNLFAMPRIGRGIYRDRSGARDAGIVSYAAVVLLLVLLFRRHLEIAAAVWAMLAIGDPAAAIAGRAFPGRGLPWNRRKSWSGVLANFAGGGIAALFAFRFVAGALPMGAAGAIVAGAAAFAFAESLSTGVEDNLVAPVAGALVLWGLLAVGPGAWADLAGSRDFLRAVVVALGVNLAVALLLGGLGVVSRSGVVAGFVFGTLILALGGWRPYAILWAFFLLGTAATRLGYRAKAARGVAQADGGRRGARHVAANCGVAAAILAVAAPRMPSVPDAVLAAVTASFAAALADTLGTEVGSLLGRRPVSLVSFARVPAGTPGAVSWPGTIAGAAGAAALAAIAWGVGMIPAGLIVVVIAAGVAGSLGESLLAGIGARRGFRLDHEFANALNTFIGAAAAAEITLSLAKGALYLPFET